MKYHIYIRQRLFDVRPASNVSLDELDFSRYPIRLLAGPMDWFRKTVQYPDSVARLQQCVHGV
jgi:hypothetical protein